MMTLVATLVVVLGCVAVGNCVIFLLFSRTRMERDRFLYELKRRRERFLSELYRPKT